MVIVKIDSTFFPSNIGNSILTFHTWNGWHMEFKEPWALDMSINFYKDTSILIKQDVLVNLNCSKWTWCLEWNSSIISRIRLTSAYNFFVSVLIHGKVKEKLIN